MEYLTSRIPSLDLYELDFSFLGWGLTFGTATRLSVILMLLKVRGILTNQGRKDAALSPRYTLLARDLQILFRRL